MCLRAYGVETPGFAICGLEFRILGLGFRVGEWCPISVPCIILSAQDSRGLRTQQRNLSMQREKQALQMAGFEKRGFRILGFRVQAASYRSSHRQNRVITPTVAH